MSENHQLIVDSPIGAISVESDGINILSLNFKEDDQTQEESSEESSQDSFLKFKIELFEYFNGKRRTFETPIAISGSDFEQKVLKEVMKIPYGTTRSYSDIATAIGKIKSIRAVASAIGNNNLLILIPCHRVIGKSGDLTGYKGGIERKRALLELEGAVDHQYTLL